MTDGLERKLWHIVEVEARGYHARDSAVPLPRQFLDLLGVDIDRSLSPVPIGMDEECALRLRELVAEGIHQLRKTGDANNPLKVRLAETNLQRVMLTLQLDAGALGAKTLGVEPLLGVLSKLCPLFPFC